jgi:hypothetical protein
MKLLEIPQPGEIKPIVWKHKSEATGLAWWVFLFLRIGRALGIEAARYAYEDMVQVITGNVAWVYKRPSSSLLGHEAVHVWQCEKRGWWRHTFDVLNLINREPYLHIEAMACAYQVVVHGANPYDRAMSLYRAPYWFRKTPSEIRGIIFRYVNMFRASGWSNENALKLI